MNLVKSKDFPNCYEIISTDKIDMVVISMEELKQLKKDVNKLFKELKNDRQI